MTDTQLTLDDAADAAGHARCHDDGPVLFEEVHDA